MPKKKKSVKNNNYSKLSADDIISKYSNKRKVRSKNEVAEKAKKGGIIPLLGISVLLFLFLAAMSTGLFGSNVLTPQTAPQTGSQDVTNGSTSDVPVYDQGIDLSGITLSVYRTSTCGCCHGFINYMRDLGATVEDNIEEQSNLNSRKASLGLTEKLYSCHTTLVDGYFVEGHIPGFVIAKLLNEKPSIDGITSPGMEAGVAGMGGDKLNVAEVLSVSSGTTSIYVSY